MFINRDYKRCENDDFTLNVCNFLDKYNDAIAVYKDGKVIGWKIKPRYE